jgi:hypothetical protein
VSVIIYVTGELVLGEQCNNMGKMLDKTLNCGQGKLMIMISGDEIITESEEVGVCGTYGGKEECIRVLAGKPLGRSMCGWDDNIQMYLQYIAWRGID